jgi:exosortase E/protease (VPEID-CTERM system)
VDGGDRNLAAQLLPGTPTYWAEQPGWKLLCNFVLVRRLAALAVLFSLELGVITIWLDSAQLSGRAGFAGFFRDWGPAILRGAVVFPVLLLAFACLRFQTPLAAVSGRIAATSVRLGLLAAHATALAVFGVLSLALYGGAPSLRPDLLAFAWLTAGLCAIGFGATAFIRGVFWTQIASSTGYLWALALVAASTAALGADAMRRLWPPATRVTFSMVQLWLRPFGSFSADPGAMTIGNSRFATEIAPACSGLEGIGLILAFTIVWLVLFRRECRFPQALVLLPVGAVLAFLLNSLRIAALILLGSAGFQGVAMGGFHSQAGWIAFNSIALGICLAAREVSWISTTGPARTMTRTPEGSTAATHANPAAAWVVPFIAILAAGMASRALSAGFEWLYSLRFFAAAIALWVFRGKYKVLNWRVDWTAPSAGLLVFAMWIGLNHSARGSMPSDLAAAPSAVAFGWLALRVLGAVVTVPVAEELAFRGFLLRRFISADFDAVSFRRFSWLAFLASSVIFGVLHGKLWISGSLAGAVYALTVMRRGRLGNAVVAHAVTNALLALDVLVFRHWNLW